MRGRQLLFNSNLSKLLDYEEEIVAECVVLGTTSEAPYIQHHQTAALLRPDHFEYCNMVNTNE